MKSEENNGKFSSTACDPVVSILKACSSSIPQKRWTYVELRFYNSSKLTPVNFHRLVTEWAWRLCFGFLVQINITVKLLNSSMIIVNLHRPAMMDWACRLHSWVLNVDAAANNSPHLENNKDPIQKTALNMESDKQS